jgi:DNA-binding SARP family transcriptional activator
MNWNGAGMDVYRFHVSGQLRLTGPDGTELRRAVSGDLRLALLTYLALGLPGMRRRDTVLAMFWPESDAEEARHRLRQVLYVLRCELGEVLVTNGREQVGLDPRRLWCDAVAFEQALVRGELEEAQSLYRGPLCDGLHISCGPAVERWLDRERERLHARATESAWDLALRYQAEGDLRSAIQWGTRALDLSVDEERLRTLIGMHDQRGDRLGALRLFRRYERTLAEDFDLTPSEETVRMIEALQSGGAPAQPVLTVARGWSATRLRTS